MRVYRNIGQGWLSLAAGFVAAFLACGACAGLPEAPEDPYARETVLAYQKAALSAFPWPLSWEIDLDDDGVNEEFLGVEGYSRGMGYALFRKTAGGWTCVSGSELIPSGHLGVERLPETDEGWHQYLSHQPLGRDGLLLESRYAWRDGAYVLVESREILPSAEDP